MNTYPVITIGRQVGSGGREIGEKLASLLGMDFYDKELIRIASRESGLGEAYFEQADEKKRFTFSGGMLGVRVPWVDEAYSAYTLSNETLFKIQSDVIRSLAAKKACLFVGRCADYVLRDHPRCLNLFISADLEDRIRRIAALQKLPEDKALSFIERTDRQRAGYYGYFSGKTWGAAASYHLCVNSSVLGIDETVSLLHYYARKRFGNPGKCQPT